MRERLARAATFPASRVGKWVTLAAWLVVLVSLAPLAAQFEDAQENRPSSFLPGSSESVEALDALAELPSGEASRSPSRQGQQLRRRSSSRLRPLRRPSSPFARACSKIPPLRALVQPSAAHRRRCLI